MMTNKIAHLFLIHIITTLDDTQRTKKKILHEALKMIDDQIQNTEFQCVLLSALLPTDVLAKKHINAEEFSGMQTLQARSSSKKDKKIRHAELVNRVETSGDLLRGKTIVLFNRNQPKRGPQKPVHR